jgi:HlyD family secretion protein
MRRRRIAAVLVVVAAAAAVLWYQRHRRADWPDDPALVLYGNVDVRRVHLGFRVGGRLHSLALEEGDAVEPNAVLGHLDAEPYELDLQRARTEQDQAAAALARLENGSRPQEIVQARAVVTEREATRNSLQVEFERTAGLITDNAVTKQALDDVTARRQEAEARLQAARAALALIEEGPRREDIAAARARLAEARSAVAQAQLRLADTALHAPCAGILLTRVEEPGAIVGAGQTVAVMSPAEPVWVRAYIPEPDLGRVWPGMKADVFTDSQPERPYSAQVGFISPEAEFTPKNIQTPHLRTDLVFRVRIVVTQPDRGLRQGMPVTVRLQIPAETSGAFGE